MRIGQGYDIHKLVENRPLIIGGINIPYYKGLFGHSDADVLIHAIIDSLLGALALGDIGEHFPDSSPEFKDVDSMELLKKVAQIVNSKGYEIINIDSTIICEKPKLLEYKLKMRENISKVLNISIDCISIKAKTNEKLDSAGRGLSIEASAVCLLKEI